MVVNQTNNMTSSKDDGQQESSASHRRRSSSEIDPFSVAEVYYGPDTSPSSKKGSKLARARTLSTVSDSGIS